jgi:hemerythrin
MEWTEALSTGVPVLDTQHRALFDCVNDLEAAAADGTLLFTIHAVDQLRTYVRFHFATEEHLMRIHEFPQLKEHIAEHRKFATKLFGLMMENTRRNNLAEMIGFLNDWLMDHVARTDMEYVPYILGRQVR